MFLNFIKSLFGFGKPNAELVEKLSQNPMLVDVRSPSEFASGSVPGAINIPVDQITANLSKFKGKENIIVFCRSGARSAMAKDALNRSGIADVTNGGTWNAVNSAMNNQNSSW
jgi:phage shock protein E